MNANASPSLIPDANVVELLAASLERLAARVSRDLDADVAEGVPPEDPAWAETISSVATYARECVAILDDPRVVAALVATQHITG